MHPHLTRLRHGLLTANEDPELLADVSQVAEDLFITIQEREDGIRDARVARKLLAQSLHPAQVMAWDPRKQMMGGLELQPTVDKIKPRRAVDVHGGAHLALGKRLGLSQVGRRHAPVRQVDLDMQGHDDNVRDENKADAHPPRRQAAPDEAVAEQEPVAAHKGHLGRPHPPRLGAAQAGRLGGEDMQPREEIEVEPGNGHDGVVGESLVPHQEVGRGVPDEGEVVVRRVDGPEEGGAGGKEGHILDIRVMVLGQVSMPSGTGIQTTLKVKLTGWFVTMWWTLWLLFHQPMDRPQQKSPTNNPRSVSKTKFWVMARCPASCAVNMI